MRSFKCINSFTQPHISWYMQIRICASLRTRAPALGVWCKPDYDHRYVKRMYIADSLRVLYGQFNPVFQLLHLRLTEDLFTFCSQVVLCAKSGTFIILLGLTCLICPLLCFFLHDASWYSSKQSCWWISYVFAIRMFVNDCPIYTDLRSGSECQPYKISVLFHDF